MTEAWDPETVFDLFGNETSREILAFASAQPVSADDLTDELSASEPTVYRHLDELTDRGLLREREHIGEDGNRYATYVTVLEAVTFTLDGGAFAVDLSLSVEP